MDDSISANDITCRINKNNDIQYQEAHNMHVTKFITAWCSVKKPKEKERIHTYIIKYFCYCTPR